jgi:hypothetical protein
MKKPLIIMMMVAGTSFLAASQAHAQISYSAGDLLINFRDTADINPVSGVDLEFDAGPVSTLAGYSGPTETLVPASVVTGVFGAPSASVPVGLSASADTGTLGAGGNTTLYMTRVDTTPGTAPTTESSQQAQSTQNTTAIDINGIGSFATSSGTSVATDASKVTAATTGSSYQALGEQNNTAAGQAAIDFGTSQNVNTSKGGDIESVNDGSANVYEALWEVPTGSASSTSDHCHPVIRC